MVKKEGTEAIVPQNMIAEEPEDFEEEIFDDLDALSDEE